MKPPPHDDPSGGEGDLFPHLPQQVPPGPFDGRGDELGADVPFAELSFGLAVNHLLVTPIGAVKTRSGQNAISSSPSFRPGQPAQLLVGLPAQLLAGQP